MRDMDKTMSYSSALSLGVCESERKVCMSFCS